MGIGKLSEGILDEAAEFAALGLDPLKFLAVSDTFNLTLMRELLDRTKKKREIIDHNFAARIAKILSP